MRKIVLNVLNFVFICLFSSTLFAHSSTLMETTLRLSDQDIELRFSVDSMVMDVLDLSLKEKEKLISKEFTPKNEGVKCQILKSESRTIAHLEQFLVTYHCDKKLGVLEFRYDGLEVIPFEENFIHIDRNGEFRERSASKKGSSFRFNAESFEFGEVYFGETFKHYILMGLKHIAFGFDHLLFLLALLLIPLNLKRLLWMVSSFTIAHSITLALSVTNVVTFSPVVVELLIAASIVFVALENILELKKRGRGHVDYPLGRRLAMTFVFGLIHGFGFSFILREVGLGQHLWVALLSFNSGVEIGQIIAIIFVYPILWILIKKYPKMQWASYVSFVVALVGTFWFVQRLGFF